jgi:DNA-binding winged helix-turn-helix (wHTH) protein/predicted ATPase
MRYVFGEWTLDTQRAELRRAGRVCRLRRKAFQVLAYLLAHPDWVVTKQELCEQVWPQQFISDAALESALKAVRQALGDSGRGQRLIQTVYGQGYRFVAAVTTEAQTPRARPAPLGSAPSGPAAMRDPVVGREAELAQLTCWWERAQGGERSFVFVTGEAGIGKTTLIDAWLARFVGEASLWMGRGQCVEQFGAGEPYRPVLEALGRLGRCPSGPAVVAVLDAQAPTWLTQMPGLVGPANLEALQRRLAGATRERMLRELAEALEVLTVQQPLVLVLEDLHWSDPSTLELLAVLARRREPARLLLLGTYRSPEVRHRAHPLQAVTQELRLHGHSVELPVTVLAEDAIATYLTTRCPGLTQVGPLARLVHQYTEGHPLFMVTLVEAWLMQGVLRAQDGAWLLHTEVEALHDQVPDSLRQMIEGQLDRLNATEQRVLEAASVAGVEFAAAAVAAGLGQTVERVDEACTVLARRGQWLRAVGDQSWPDGTVAGGYRFGHALYQQVLYGRVAAARRVRLHQRIGAREEVGYGTQAGTMAAELAVHFVQGRDYPRAVQYLRQAGENAIQRSAYLEAISHFTTGIELLTTLPETPERTQQALTLSIALGAALQVTKGHAAPEVEHAYTQAYALCQQVGKTPALVPVLLGLWRFYVVRAQLQRARELGDTLLRLAHWADDPALAVLAHYTLGVTWFYLGALSAARRHLEEGIGRYTRDQRHALVFRMGIDPGVGCRSFDAMTLWLLGYPAQALAHIHEALALAHELSHPYSLGWAQCAAAFVAQFRRDVLAAHAQAEATVALATEHGFSDWVAWGTSVRGWALAMQGQGEEGITQLRQGIVAFQAGGSGLNVPCVCTMLAEISAHLGHTEDGLQALAEAHILVEQHEESWWEAEVHRLRGVLLLQQQGIPQAEAETCFQQALDVARHQEAKSLELRAAMSLARLWQEQGKRAEAYELLAPIYGWFTEGFDTADLHEAKALLDALA